MTAVADQSTGQKAKSSPLSRVLSLGPRNLLILAVLLLVIVVSWAGINPAKDELARLGTVANNAAANYNTAFARVGPEIEAVKALIDSLAPAGSAGAGTFNQNYGEWQDEMSATSRSIAGIFRELGSLRGNISSLTTGNNAIAEFSDSIEFGVAKDRMELSLHFAYTTLLAFDTAVDNHDGYRVSPISPFIAGLDISPRTDDPFPGRRPSVTRMSLPENRVSELLALYPEFGQGFVLLEPSE